MKQLSADNQQDTSLFNLHFFKEFSLKRKKQKNCAYLYNNGFPPVPTVPERHAGGMLITALLTLHNPVINKLID